MANLQPIHKQRQDAYLQSGLQPSTGSVVPFRKVEVEKKRGASRIASGAVGAAATSTRATGITMRAGGAAMQAAGKTSKGAGRGLTRAGASLSSTGIGAIVGVPTAVAGVGLQGTGIALDASGRVVRRVGKGVSRAGRKAKVAQKGISKLPNRISKGKVVAVNGLVGGFLTSLWLLQFFCWLAQMFSLMLLAVMYQFVDRNVDEENNESFSVSIGDFFLGAISSLFRALDTATEKLLGIDLDAIAAAINPETWFMFFTVLILMIGLTSLMTLGLTYTISGIRPFFGKGTLAKQSTFLLAIILYVTPIVNLIPWYWIWAAAVWKNPK